MCLNQPHNTDVWALQVHLCNRLEQIFTHCGNPLSLLTPGLSAPKLFQLNREPDQIPRHNVLEFFKQLQHQQNVLFPIYSTNVLETRYMDIVVGRDWLLESIM